MIQLTISADAAGQRLDKLVRKALRDVPLSHVYKMFRTRKVRVNGARGRAEQLLAEGDVVVIRGDEERLLAPPAPGGAPAKVTFRVVYEDADILAVDKPAGLAAHPGTGIEGATLVEMARTYLETPELPPTEFRPSPAHRLDRDTSGIVLVAKHRKAMVRLTEIFTSGEEVHKTYLALVKGKMPREVGTIDLPLSEHEQTSRSKATRGVKFQEAVTRWKVVSSGKEASLLSVRIETGRTHQYPPPPRVGRAPGGRRSALRRLRLEPAGAGALGAQAHGAARLEAEPAPPGDRRAAQARGAAAARAGRGAVAGQPRAGCRGCRTGRPPRPSRLNCARNRAYIGEPMEAPTTPESPRAGEASEPIRARVVLDGLPRRSLARRALRWLLFLAIGCVNAALLVLIAGYVHFARGLPDIPTLARYRPPIVTRMISADGQLAGEFFNERRKVVPYERIPKKLVQAFVASEDQHFFEHGGIDLLGTLRAAINTYVLRKHIQGGSTITQQTAKSILISAEGFERGTQRSLSRKIRELILARRLEAAFTKEQILWLYLNGVYLGHHSYGVQAAAENYYRKNVEDLTLREAALIAGLPQAPSRYSPFLNPAAARERRRYVLRRMVQEGMITAGGARRGRAGGDQGLPGRRRLPRDRALLHRDGAPADRRPLRQRPAPRGWPAGRDDHGLEKQRAAQAAVLKGLQEVDHRQGWYGPAGHFSGADAVALEERLARRLAQGAARRRRSTASAS